MKKKKVKVVFIGCVTFSKEMVESLLRSKFIEVVGIVTKKRAKFNSDFFSLNEIAKTNSIPCFLYGSSKKKQL